MKSLVERKFLPHKPPDRASVEQAISRTQQYLLGIQRPEGYWKGELEADPSVSAGYIPMMHFMGIPIDPARLSRIVNTLRRKQNEDGSWSSYYGGPGDISVSVQVYFALKLGGAPPDADYLQRARDFILEHGGVPQTNLITRIWLACFGQFDWQAIPSIPPEIALLPKWSYINIYECSSWARATIVALSSLSAIKPVCPVPAGARLDELYNGNGRRPKPAQGNGTRLLSWETFFLAADRLLKIYDKIPVKPLRGLAMRQALDWVLEHQDSDGSWGGIMLPWVYSLFALKSQGFPLDHPAIARGLAGLESFIVEGKDSFLLEPAVSPVWDTAWAILALRESGLAADHPALVKAARWLLGKEIRVKGDWSIKNPNTEAGCWAFEFENRHYPDVDDTAEVSRALSMVKLPGAEESAKAAAIQRGTNWVASMQGSDGGWAAFDFDNEKQILAHIPFSDFITPLDPASPDVTNHAIDLLSLSGETYRPVIEKGVAYLKHTQEPDGAWFGRWGVNYVYGTGLVLPSLKAAGEDASTDYIRRAVWWLKEHQTSDGGWGESCRSYEDPSFRGSGDSTASQTAWALIGLLAAGERSAEVERGIAYLLRTQPADGAWREDAFTGTGFPRAFYLRYDLYRVYFPLIALARYNQTGKAE